MTTEPHRSAPFRGGSVLLGAAAASLLACALVILLGALRDGTPAAYGALAGTLLVVAVFGAGSFAVDLVAGLMPAASLLFALLTYTLQVLLMALAFVGLTRSGLLDDALDRQWLAGAVITGTVAWLTAQVFLATRQRIPAYDLPDRGPSGPDEAGAR